MLHIVRLIHAQPITSRCNKPCIATVNKIIYVYIFVCASFVFYMYVYLLDIDAMPTLIDLYMTWPISAILAEAIL